jgi:hypothetical protein
MNNTALTTLPEKLFGKLSGTLEEKTYYFNNMFNGCKAITSASPKIATDDGYKYIYEIWPNATTYNVGKMFAGDTLMADYANIPTNYKK